MFNDPSGPPALFLTLKPGVIHFLFILFQKGVLIQGRLGCSIRSFLHEQLHFAQEYIEERIQTFFLNGKAVDDIDSAMIRDGSTLALSAAMPGLLGATLRKGSYYADMRSSISHKEAGTAVIPHEGSVKLKLFNLLTPEMGPAILRQGAWIEGKDLQELMEKLPQIFWRGCLDIRANGKSAKPSALTTIHWGEKVFLRAWEA